MVRLDNWWQSYLYHTDINRQCQDCHYNGYLWYQTRKFALHFNRFLYHISYHLRGFLRYSSSLLNLIVKMAPYGRFVWLYNMSVCQKDYKYMVLPGWILYGEETEHTVKKLYRNSNTSHTYFFYFMATVSTSKIQIYRLTKHVIGISTVVDLTFTI